MFSEYTDLGYGYTNVGGPERESKLESMDLAGLAKFLQEKPRRVVLLTGAGVSVNAGIPDYRSKGGFYDTLDADKFDISEDLKEQIRDTPETVYHKDFFRQHPEVMWTCIAPLYTEHYEPTATHYFMTLLARRSKTCDLFTQNVDGLHRRAGFPNDSCCEVHGTRIEFKCNRKKCNADIEFDLEDATSFCKNRTELDVPKCPSLRCGFPIRPDVVLFGENLPANYRSCLERISPPDVLIVAGTSLKVSPVNMLVRKVGDDCIRVLVNMTKVGTELGMFSRANSHRDLFIRGDCDTTFKTLAALLDWETELDELMEAGERFVDSARDLETYIAPDRLDVEPQKDAIGCAEIEGRYERWQGNLYLKENSLDIRIDVAYDLSESFGPEYQAACIIFRVQDDLEKIILYAAEKYGESFMSIAGLNPAPKRFT